MSKNKNSKQQNQNQQNDHYIDPQEQNFQGLQFNNHIHDSQYSKMVPNKIKKNSSNSYFLTQPKYQGTNKHYQSSASEQQNIDNPQNGIKQALINLNQNRKTNSRLFEEDFKVIQEQDHQNLIKIKKQTNDGNSKHLKNQLHQFNKLIQIRHFSQTNMENIKKFPSNNYPYSPQLNTSTKNLQKTVLKNIDHLSNNYWSLATQTFQNLPQQNNKESYDQILNYPNLLSNMIDVQYLWQQFQNQTKFINKQIQEEIIKWSQKTTLLKNSSKGQYNSLIMQTPIGQTKKIMKDWNRVSSKAQQKRSVFKILFQNHQNIKFPSDKSLYDDFDFYQQVQKIYQKQIQEDDQDDFRISDTMKHIKQRQARRANKIKKDVDRKASKNRKLRFNVHPKLLNFMPCQLDNTIEARDQIVNNIFNNRGSIQGEQVDYIDM